MEERDVVVVGAGPAGLPEFPVRVVDIRSLGGYTQ